MSHRWMKFWPQDWESDVALRVVSLSAQGLWARLICAMHRSDPYGHLTMNGRPMSVRQVASLASINEREAQKLLDELEAAGVFSRDQNGAIFSRRMVRDRQHSDLGKSAVERRWAKRKEGDTPNRDPITPPITPPNREPHRGPIDTPNSLETEAESETEKKEPSSLRSDGAEPAPLDARTQLFRTGLADLRHVTGLPDGRARALLGKCLKAAGDNVPVVAEAIARCVDARPADPVPWLLQACQAPQFRNGFLAVIAAEGWGEGGPEPEEARNPFLIGGKHGAH